MKKPTTSSSKKTSPSKKKGQSKYDSPWKMLIERHFREFLAFFFPDIEQAVDWASPPRSLDKELESLDPDPDSGSKDLRVDKLFDVDLLSSEHTKVQVHVEVQGDPQESFETRMFLYASRIYDRHRQPVISLAILGDVDKPEWKPTEFGWTILGSRLEMEFPVAKLAEYDEKALEASSNPFALVALAHLKAKATRGEAAVDERIRWKVWLVRRLYEKGFSKPEVIDLFRFIDGVLYLSEDASKQFHATIDQLEGRKTMDYIAPFEQRAMEIGWTKGHEEGHKEGREEGQRDGQIRLLDRLIQRRFNETPDWVHERLAKASTADLNLLSDRILDAQSLSDLFEEK